MVYEIEHPRINEALLLLKNIPEVAGATPFGKRLHVLTKETMQDSSLIKKTLKEKGLDAFVRNIPPSLEDVFIYLFEKRNSKSHLL
jgi:phospholipid N-methyltransferase